MGKKSRNKATQARKPPPPPVDPLDAVHAAATTPAWLVATRDDAVAVKLLETLERAVAKLPRTSPPIPGPTDDARQRLYAWAKDNGCACEHVKLESFEDGQTRVVSTKTIGANDVVMKVPSKLHLRATDDDAMGVAAFARTHNLDATLALAKAQPKLGLARAEAVSALADLSLSLLDTRYSRATTCARCCASLLCSRT